MYFIQTAQLESNNVSSESGATTMFQEHDPSLKAQILQECVCLSLSVCVCVCISVWRGHLCGNRLGLLGMFLTRMMCCVGIKDKASNGNL